MIRLSRIGLLAGVVVLMTMATARAEDKKPASFGKIVRLDPAFDKLVAKDAVLEPLAVNKFEWSEGPVWIKGEKALLFSDIPRNMVWKWSEKDGLTVFLKPSGYTGKPDFTGREPGSNALTIDKQGRLLLCQHGDRRIAAWDPKEKKFITLADKYMGKRFNSPNDLVIKSNGDIYFTDPPYGLPKNVDDPAKELDFQGVFRLTPKGEITLLTKEMSRPNGLAFSPDEKILYVANSDPKSATWMQFPVLSDGTLGEGKVFFDSTSMQGERVFGLPDGMKVDVNGNLWATGPGGVLVFTKEGKHLGTLATGVATANCGWGDDGSVLYICADKNLLRIKTLTKGNGW